MKDTFFCHAKEVGRTPKYYRESERAQWGQVLFEFVVFCNVMYLAILMSEAAEASQYYFFEKILIKLKCPHLPNVLLPFFELGSQL